MGLFDPDELGFWQGFQNAQRLLGFLPFDQAAAPAGWIACSGPPGRSPRAQGNATVVADMADGGESSSARPTSLLEVKVRDGQARIAPVDLS